MRWELGCSLSIRSHVLRAMRPDFLPCPHAERKMVRAGSSLLTPPGWFSEGERDQRYRCVVVLAVWMAGWAQASGGTSNPGLFDVSPGNCTDESACWTEVHAVARAIRATTIVRREAMLMLP